MVTEKAEGGAFSTTRGLIYTAQEEFPQLPRKRRAQGHLIPDSGRGVAWSHDAKRPYGHPRFWPATGEAVGAGGKGP